MTGHILISAQPVWRFYDDEMPRVLNFFRSSKYKIHVFSLEVEARIENLRLLQQRRKAAVEIRKLNLIYLVIFQYLLAAAAASDAAPLTKNPEPPPSPHLHCVFSSTEICFSTTSVSSSTSCSDSSLAPPSSSGGGVTCDQVLKDLTRGESLFLRCFHIKVLVYIR